MFSVQSGVLEKSVRKSLGESLSTTGSPWELMTKFLSGVSQLLLQDISRTPDWTENTFYHDVTASSACDVTIQRPWCGGQVVTCDTGNLPIRIRAHDTEMTHRCFGFQSQACDWSMKVIDPWRWLIYGGRSDFWVQSKWCWLSDRTLIGTKYQLDWKSHDSSQPNN